LNRILYKMKKDKQNGGEKQLDFDPHQAKSIYVDD
jgi:hypothetical protein